jgi:hypothetical protein
MHWCLTEQQAQWEQATRVVAIVDAVAGLVVGLAAAAVVAAAAHVLFPSSPVDAAYDSCSCSSPEASSVAAKIAETGHDPDCEQETQTPRIAGPGTMSCLGDCPAGAVLVVCHGRAAASM